MKRRKKWIFIGLLILILGIGLRAYYSKEQKNYKELTVHFIDVGQGDTTLVVCDGEAMLIDAGNNSVGTKVQLYLTKQGIDKLKYVIGTHPDADHIGGMDVILYKFDCENVLMTTQSSDTNSYRDVVDTMRVKGYQPIHPECGDSFSLGDAEFTILGPAKEYEKANDNSIIVKLVHGDNTFLFSGDAQYDAEQDLLNGGMDIDVDVYKVGHHGSSNASSQKFLQAMSPTYAVISCGKDNKYGHPHAGTLNRLREQGVQLFRTDEQGSITVVSDGHELRWNCSPTDNWQAGENVMNNDEEVRTLPVTEEVQSEETEKYAVNSKNGKIHIIGQCTATGTGDGAMKAPVYFETFQEAESFSAQIEENGKKRKCGNCFK